MKEMFSGWSGVVVLGLMGVLLLLIVNVIVRDRLDTHAFIEFSSELPGVGRTLVRIQDIRAVQYVRHPDDAACDVKLIMSTSLLTVPFADEATCRAAYTEITARLKPSGE